MIFVNLLIAMFAYRPLLGLGTRSGLNLEEAVDSWFFVAEDTTPIIAVLMCVWLLYRRRAALWALPAQCGSPALVAFFLTCAAGALVWAVCSRVGPLLAISLAFNLLGFALMQGGRPALRLVSLPAFCLLFALPIPAPLLNEVVFRFQIWSAEYAGWILQHLGVPAFVSGDQLLQDGKRFVVIESCSGLRSVETLTMLAVLLVDLFHRRGLHAVLVVAAAPFVAFALNGFRVVGLILNPYSRIAEIHTLQGIIILLGGLIALHFLDGLLARTRLDDWPGWQDRATGPAQRTAPALLVTVVLLLSAAASHLLPSWVPKATATSLVSASDVEEGLEGWVATRLNPSQLTFFFGSTSLRQTVYKRYRLSAERGDQVDLFVGFGNHMGQSSPISPKTGFPGSGWAIEDEEVISLEPGGREVLARTLRSETQRVLSYHWYEGAEGLARETLRSLLSLDRTPWHRDREAMTVRVSTELQGPNSEDREVGAERLARFYASLEPALAPKSGTLNAAAGADLAGSEVSLVQ